MMWHEIPGWSCRRTIELYEEVCAEKKTGVFVECGVAYGKSLAYLASIADPAVDILAVDVWHTFQGRNGLDPAKYREIRQAGFQQPMAAARWFVDEHLRTSSPKATIGTTGFIPSLEHASRFARIEWVQAKSEDVPKYLDFDVDFVFLDDHHEYESVLAEIRAWLPRLKPGGIIAGHDINQHYPGVERAVREAITELFGGKWRDVDIRPPHPDENGWGGCWVWRKP